MNTQSGCLFSPSKIGSDDRENKDLNKIETDYRNKEDLNQVETNYRDDEDDINIETNYNNNEDNVKVEIDYGNDKESIFLKTAICHILSLPYSCSANVLDPDNDIASMAEFDMMRLNLLADPIAVGPGLLTSAANWECGNTQDIYAKILEVSRIY